MHAPDATNTSNIHTFILEYVSFKLNLQLFLVRVFCKRQIPAKTCVRLSQTHAVQERERERERERQRDRDRDRDRERQRDRDREKDRERERKREREYVTQSSSSVSLEVSDCGTKFADSLLG